MIKTIIILIVGLLLQSCSSNPFHSESYWIKTNENNIKQKIQNGVNIHEEDWLGFTPLHYAAEYGDIKSIYTLINAGADVNVMNDYGVTPLNKAVYKRRNIGIIKTLINLGAYVNGFSVGGNNMKVYSILDLTEHKSISNNWTRSSNEVINLLKQHGAKYKQYSYGKGGNDFGEIATALAGVAVLQYQANKNIANAQSFNNLPTTQIRSGGVPNNSSCSPLPARCKSANASAERQLINCKSQDTGGIRGAALSQKCALNASIYAGQICEREFRTMGKHGCANTTRQQIVEWQGALNSANQTIRQVSGSGSSGGSTFTGGGGEYNTGSGTSYSGEKYCGDPKYKKPWRPGCGVK